MAAAAASSRRSRATTSSRGFRPNGQQIVYRRIGGDGLQVAALQPGPRRVRRSRPVGGEPKLVTEEGQLPTLQQGTATASSSSAERGGRASGALISVNLTGGDRRVHLTAENATQFVPSPDERYVAWVERFNAYVAPLPLTGKAVDVSTSVADFPCEPHLARRRASYLHWSPDSRRVYWALGPELFQRDISATFAFETQDTTTSARSRRARAIPIGFKAAADKSDGQARADRRARSSR